MDDTFESILLAAQAGGEWAVAELFRSTHPALVRYLGARLGHDADDVASQVWLEAARSLRSFSGDEAAFRRWLFTIAHRRMANELRNRHRRRSTATADDVLEWSAPSSASAEDEAVDAAGGDRAAAMIAAVLPPELAEIVLLRVVAGLSADEVAEITGKRAATIRVLQHRALRRLRRAAEENLTEGVTP
ncbi:MAG: RNA polymerase sigma factor [Actinobacteria bacterium]|nr:RNA polymerase sigma factor [Actinomycetota bacterium]